MKTPSSPQVETTETLKDSDGVMDVPKTHLAEAQTPAAIPTQLIEETSKEIVRAQEELRENVNVYTSRFDDENIWANISRSTERLDMEWAKMPPLPKLTPSTQRNKTKCHCQLYKRYGSKESLSSDMCKCKSSLSTPYKYSDLTKYGNMLTKNLLNNNRNTNETTIPQPLKPTTLTADCHLFHHEHKHKLTLDLKHPCMKRDNTDLQLENTTKVEPNTNTNNDTCNENNYATSTATYERSNSRSKYRKSPRLECHTRTRCYSHDRLMGHSKTEPLTWLQQHLVLKQTIKTCHKFPTTITNCEDDLTHPCHKIETPATTCCQAQHIIRTCCNNKECLREEVKRATKEEQTQKQEHVLQQKEVTKQEQDKSTNTEEIKEEKKLTKTKPVKVDINVRLVPKSSKREKAEAKSAVATQKSVERNAELLEDTMMVVQNPSLDLDNQEIRTEF